jgi:hypothetical protein
MVKRWLAAWCALTTLTLFCIVGAAWGSNTGRRTTLVGTAVAWAHVVIINGTPTLDTSATYGVSGVTRVDSLTLAGSAPRSGVCIYGRFTPQAVSATADIPYAGPPLWFAVSILASWLPSLCPQGQANGAPHPIVGHVVAFLATDENVMAAGKGGLTCSQDNPKLLGPSHCAHGYWLVFY